MRNSRPIEVDGHFLGVAVSLHGAWRFIATDPAVQDLDGDLFPSAAEVAAAARLVFRRSRAPHPLPAAELRA